jgi:hypothetical protein
VCTIKIPNNGLLPCAVTNAVQNSQSQTAPEKVAPDVNPALLNYNLGFGFGWGYGLVVAVVPTTTLPRKLIWAVKTQIM